ncbi:SDR family oxidoreductase [Blautia schinkii]|nr:SDR family oxidoreductase [Blautia schinkii]
MLRNKTAIVTGASGGIGSEIVQLFLENKAKVIGIYNAHKAKIDSRIDSYKVDITNTKDCEAVFEKIIERHGCVDILVNCAGITRDAMTKRMTEEQFDEVLAVNLKGVWNLTRVVGPHMQEQKGGSIINISSVVGIYGNIGQANYAATKSGLLGLTKSWAKEFSYNGGNVRVNAIAPGYTLTSMLETVPEVLLERFSAQTMLGRLAQPREIANVALFLASDLSSYITGATIQADGGMRL